MKRHLFPLLALMSVFVCSETAFAYDFMAENEQGIAIYYDVLSESECAVTSNIIKDELSETFSTNYVGDITIPAQVEYDGRTMNVVEMRESAFEYAYYLTSLSLPETMRKIAGLYECTGLKKVFFSSIESACKMDISLGGLMNFDGNFYVNGEVVSDLIIPESVTTINTQLFESCRSIRSVSFPSTFKAIEKGCFTAALNRVEFADMETLFNVQLWNHDVNCSYDSWNLTPFGIDYHLYVDGQEITDLVVPENVQDIPDYLFAGNKYLNSVTLHDKVRSIGKATFMYCCGISQLNNTESIENVGEAAFLECEQLQGELSLPNTKRIGNGAFCKCSSLTAVDLPAIQDSLIHVFYDTDLKNVHLGENLTYLGSSTFYAVEKMKLDAKTPPEASSDCIVTIFNTTIEVPLGCRDIYMKENPWTNAQRIIETGEPDSDHEESITLVTEGLNRIEFFAPDGRYLGAEVVNGGHAAFQTSEPVVIVKMAGKTIKVVL